MSNFFDTVGWSPGIGDPTFVGWLTVSVYFYCAYLAIKVCKNSDRVFLEPIQRQRILWMCIGLAMLALGINKQLDIQTLFTATAKYLAYEYNWYQDRREYQKLFIVALLICGVVGLSAMFFIFRRILKHHIFAIFGLGAIVVFVMIRASSFHNVDLFLGSSIMGIKMNWLLELSGIGLVVFNAKRLLWGIRPLIDIDDQGHIS